MNASTNFKPIYDPNRVYYTYLSSNDGQFWPEMEAFIKPQKFGHNDYTSMKKPHKVGDSVYIVLVYSNDGPNGDYVRQLFETRKDAEHYCRNFKYECRIEKIKIQP
jgi:hypothetical protein